MSRHFDSVNTGELPTSECNQWMTGILKIYEMYVNKNGVEGTKTLKVVTQNQPPILIHRGAKSPNFYNSDPRNFKQTPL